MWTDTILTKPCKNPTQVNKIVPFSVFCFWEGQTMSGKGWSSFRVLMKLRSSHKHMHRSLCLSMQLSTCQYTETFNFHSLMSANNSVYSTYHILGRWDQKKWRRHIKTTTGWKWKGKWQKLFALYRNMEDSQQIQSESKNTKKIKLPYLKKTFLGFKRGRGWRGGWCPVHQLQLSVN